MKPAPQRPIVKLREVQWRLHAVMADRGFRSITELARTLQEHGMDISSNQLTRIVKQVPARLNTDLLFTLMSVLGCDANELFRVVDKERQLKTAASSSVENSLPKREPAAPPSVIGPRVHVVRSGQKQDK